MHSLCDLGVFLLLAILGFISPFARMLYDVLNQGRHRVPDSVAPDETACLVSYVAEGPTKPVHIMRANAQGRKATPSGPTNFTRSLA